MMYGFCQLGFDVWMYDTSSFFLFQVDFKRMTKAEMEAFQRANPGCQLVVRKVSSPCVVRTPCATLVRRLAPCSPPVIYAPCRTPPPCQTKTVRRRISASSKSSASVSKEITPTVTVTNSDTPCE